MEEERRVGRDRNVRDRQAAGRGLCVTGPAPLRVEGTGVLIA